MIWVFTLLIVDLLEVIRLNLIKMIILDFLSLKLYKIRADFNRGYESPGYS